MGLTGHCSSQTIIHMVALGIIHFIAQQFFSKTVCIPISFRGVCMWERGLYEVLSPVSR